MEVKIQRGDIKATAAEAVVLLHFEGDDKLLNPTAAVDTVSGSVISRVIDSGDFRGEHLENILLFTQGSGAIERILLMGLGKRENFTTQALRETMAQALKTLRDRRQRRAVLPIPLDSEFPLTMGETAEACVLGGMLGLYQFTELLTKERDKIQDFDSLTIISSRKTKDLAKGVDRAKAVAAGIYLARDLVTLPSNQGCSGADSGSVRPNVASMLSTAR